MNRRLIPLVAVAMLSIMAMAVASGINISGTWVLDKEKSDQPTMGPGGPGGGGGPRGPVDITLVIKQADNELQITRKMSRNGQETETGQKFTLDGKDNTNPAGMGRGEFKSKTKIDTDKIVTEGTQKRQTQRGEFEVGIKEEYSLSADGKVLTIETTRNAPGGENTRK